MDRYSIYFFGANNWFNPSFDHVAGRLLHELAGEVAKTF